MNLCFDPEHKYLENAAVAEITTANILWARSLSKNVHVSTRWFLNIQNILLRTNSLQVWCQDQVKEYLFFHKTCYVFYLKYTVLMSLFDVFDREEKQQVTGLGGSCWLWLGCLTAGHLQMVENPFTVTV